MNKLMAGLSIAVLLVLGIVGLVLPIIPGIVFLALAAFVAVRAFPHTRRHFDRYPRLGRHLDRADAYASLGVGDKLRVVMLHTAAIAAEGAEKLARAVRSPRRV